MTDKTVSSLSTSTMLTHPVWVNAPTGDTAVTYPDDQDRRLIKSIFQSSGPAIPGANPNPNQFKIVERPSGSGGPNFSVNVTAGGYCIVADNGYEAYYVMTTADINIPFNTLTTNGIPASGTRQHRVIVRIYDTGTPGAEPHWEFQVLEDTGGGIRSLPSNSASLGYVTATSSTATFTNATMTDERGLRNPPGSIIRGNSYLGSTQLGATHLDDFTARDTTMRTGDVSVVAGRRYRIDVGYTLQTSSGPANSIYVYNWLKNSAGTNIDVVVNPAWLVTSTNAAVSFNVSLYAEPTVSGTQNYQFWMVCDRVGSDAYNWCYVARGTHTFMSISDVGPALTAA